MMFKDRGKYTQCKEHGICKGAWGDDRFRSHIYTNYHPSEFTTDWKQAKYAVITDVHLRNTSRGWQPVLPTGCRPFWNEAAGDIPFSGLRQQEITLSAYILECSGKTTTVLLIGITASIQVCEWLSTLSDNPTSARIWCFLSNKS